MSVTDYSKWDHIDISDDEDDTHPNVDTPSLFRWRHTARVDREADEKQTSAKKNAESKLRVNQIDVLNDRIKKLTVDGGKEEQIKGVKQEIEELEKEHQEFEKKEKELKEYQDAHPNWNVDNMSQDKHNRTIINKEPKKDENDPTNDLTLYFKTYDKECKQFGMMKKYEESHKFLRANMNLVCEHLGSFLVIWAVDLAVEDKHELKERVAHQAIIAQYIMELAKTLKRDPRSCVDAFFNRISTAEKQYKDAFDDEFKALIKRIDARKLARIEEAKEKLEEEEKEARQGPGGLDPLEVLNSLPAEMKRAFEEQDTPALKASFSALPPDEMNKYYNMVVDSGLWVPSPDDKPPVSNETIVETKPLTEETD